MELLKAHVHWAALAGTAAWSMLLLAVVYAVPLNGRQEIGTGWALGATGLYAPEANGEISYVYTQGAASLVLPEVGAGRFELGIRMGGPAGHVPVQARAEVAGQAVDLGTLQAPRVYHIFVAAMQPGDIELALHTTTARLRSEHRDLGVLLGEIGMRSIGASQAPAPVLIATPIILALLAAAGMQTSLRRQMRLAASILLLLGTALPLGYALGRGRVAALPWWTGLAIVAAGVMMLYHFGERPLRRPIAQITALFLAWRAALWAMGAVGVWYSSTVYRLGQAETWAGAISPRRALPWQALAEAWVQWDGKHYEAIALHGYPAVEQRFPDIAFFPLYPMLTRLALPLAGGSVTIAALLVSHVALLAALILAYDLVARDFGATVAARTVVFVLIFPASLFFVAAYSESLGLVLLVVALWAMRRERWWLAGAAGLGLALAFMAAQHRWQNHLEPPWRMPLDFVASITSHPHPEVRMIQLVVWIAFLGLTMVALRRLPPVYGLTAVLLLIPPYLSSWHESLPRHVLLAFPAFVVMAIYANRGWVRGLAITTGLMLLCLATMLYVNGFWVA